MDGANSGVTEHAKCMQYRLRQALLMGLMLIIVFTGSADKPRLMINSSELNSFI